MLEIKLQKWVQQGYTLAHEPDSGLPIFVHGGMPGEVVRIEIIKKRKNHQFGIVREVLEPASDRQPSDCEIFPSCGGCSFRHIDYESELRIKIELLGEFKRLQSILDQLDFKIHNAEPVGYRNQIQLQFENNKPGFYKLHTNQHIALPEHGCRLVSPQMNATVNRLDDEEKKTRLIMREIEDRCFPVHSAEYIPYKVKLEDGYEIDWQYNSMGFWQINRHLLPVWLQEIRNQVPEKPWQALELFCGTALIGGALADRLQTYTGMDNSKSSLAAARRNRDKLPKKHKLLTTDLYARPGDLPPAHLMLVNPPRAGLPRWLREAIADHPARSLLYSSCNPATLERDLAALQEANFMARHISVFDFFPRTPHLEVLLYLERAV